VGAVNCAREKEMCAEWFAVPSYPMLMLVGSDERGTQQTYTQARSKDPAAVVEWVRGVAEEWRWLYAQVRCSPRSCSRFDWARPHDGMTAWPNDGMAA